MRSLADIVDEAQQLALRTERSFDVMVPVSRAIRLANTGKPPPEWRSQRESPWPRSELTAVPALRRFWTGTPDGLPRTDSAGRRRCRVQVFAGDGTYTAQGFVNRNAESASTVAGLAFSPDAEQRFIYTAEAQRGRRVQKFSFAGTAPAR